MLRYLAIFLLLPTLAFANDWQALDQPGAIAIMRHALAPGTGDPTRVVIDDCTTQRNLDDRGRAQARAIGQAFRERSIAFDTVLTSQWCRCRETAELLDLGMPQDAPSLNSFFSDRSTREAQTEATRDMIRGLDGRAMLVTHQVNITALTGEFARSGEVLVIRLSETGTEVLGRIMIDP